MASSNSCSACPKGAGTCYCPGCKAYFCNKDFIKHRGMLVNGLDELTIGRNELKEKINKASSPEHSGSSLLSRIDAWQEATTQKVKGAAQQARQQVLKIINTKREEITSLFQALSKELETLRETEDVLEQDLSRLKSQIEQLNKGLEKLLQPPAIELNISQSEQIAWHSMIYVEAISTSTAKNRPKKQLQGEHLSIH